MLVAEAVISARVEPSKNSTHKLTSPAPTPVEWDSYPPRISTKPWRGIRLMSEVASFGGMAVGASRVFQPPVGAGITIRRLNWPRLTEACFGYIGKGWEIGISV